MIIIDYFVVGHDPQIEFTDDSIILGIQRGDKLRVVKPHRYNPSDYIAESPIDFSGKINVYIEKIDNRGQYQLNILKL